MNQFIGYSFFSGPDCLSSAPSQVDNITQVELANAVFDHFNVTRDTSIPISTDIPSQWTYDTVLDAGFENNLDAGNVDFLVSQITSIKIKRRVKGAFNWLTLDEIPINDLSDLAFIFTDRLNANNVQYEYALVPTIEGAEGNYIITEVLSKFNGVFIGDAEQSFKFLYEVENQFTQNQQIGVFTPLGKSYPIIVANGQQNYKTGSFSAMVLNDSYDTTKTIDTLEIAQKMQTLLAYLTNKKAKVLKDWNGNEWLIIVTGNPQVSYASGSGLGIPIVQIGWTEIGNSNNQQDLYNSGIIDEVG